MMWDLEWSWAVDSWSGEWMQHDSSVLQGRMVELKRKGGGHRNGPRLQWIYGCGGGASLSL